MLRSAHVPAGVRPGRNANLQRLDARDVQPVRVGPRHKLAVSGTEQRRLQGEDSTQAPEQWAEVQKLQWILGNRKGHARDRRECRARLIDGDQHPILQSWIVVRWGLDAEVR